VFSNWATRNLSSFPKKLYQAVVKFHSNSDNNITDEKSCSDVSNENEKEIAEIEVKEQKINIAISAQYYDSYEKYKDEIDRYLPVRKTQAAINKHGESDNIRRKALYFMLRAIREAGCLCNHNTLAQITLEFATDENGKLLKEYSIKAFDLMDFILEDARSILPPERIFGKTGSYKAEACQCELAEHKRFVVKRRDNLK
jgi:hypothetical protein